MLVGEKSWGQDSSVQLHVVTATPQGRQTVGSPDLGDHRRTWLRRGWCEEGPLTQHPLMWARRGTQTAVPQQSERSCTQRGGTGSQHPPPHPPPPGTIPPTVLPLEDEVI